MMSKIVLSKKKMMCKFDVENAYDRLSWDVLYKTLVDVGLPGDWINHIS